MVVYVGYGVVGDISQHFNSLREHIECLLIVFLIVDTPLDLDDTLIDVWLDLVAVNG